MDHLVVCNCDPDSPDLLWMAPYFVTIRRGTSAPIVVLSACQGAHACLAGCLPADLPVCVPIRVIGQRGSSGQGQGILHYSGAVLTRQCGCRWVGVGESSVIQGAGEAADRALTTGEPREQAGLTNRQLLHT